MVLDRTARRGRTSAPPAIADTLSEAAFLRALATYEDGEVADFDTAIRLEKAKSLEKLKIRGGDDEGGDDDYVGSDDDKVGDTGGGMEGGKIETAEEMDEEKSEVDEEPSPPSKKSIERTDSRRRNSRKKIQIMTNDKNDSTSKIDKSPPPPVSPPGMSPDVPETRKPRGCKKVPAPPVDGGKRGLEGKTTETRRTRLKTKR
eukprot:GHVO01039691.1.p1 GENE.GHVO01039691.1~~GHVO01039691.1.p1  ORF type:complete len:202 (-),score=63.05 GHVO01039691.1:24-629(-)